MDTSVIQHRRPSRLGGMLATGLRYYIKSGARGCTRCTFLLAQHFKALQAVPVTINGNQRLYVDLRDGLSHLLLAGSPWESVPWERREQEFMRQMVRPGDVVFDVGAHIGLHSVMFAAAIGPTGRLHAFEANPKKISPLAETIGRLPNATLHRFGLSDRPGEATLFVPEDQTMTSLADWTEGRVGAVGRTSCVLRTIDDVIEAGDATPPDFIKCDVEGAEASVFKGARRTLDRSDSAVLFYEADARSARAFGNDVAAATRFLLSLRAPAYSIFWVRKGGLAPIEAPGGKRQHFNLVAVPASRMDRIASVPRVAEEL
jgi:FkbM family methyltransferase